MLGCRMPAVLLKQEKPLGQPNAQTSDLRKAPRHNQPRVGAPASCWLLPRPCQVKARVPHPEPRQKERRSVGFYRQ